jgi:hypothetical protein
MTGFEPTVEVVVAPEDDEPPELELAEPLDEEPELEPVDPAEPELVEPLPDFALAEPAAFVVFLVLAALPA